MERFTINYGKTDEFEFSTNAADRRELVVVIRTILDDGYSHIEIKDNQNS